VLKECVAQLIEYFDGKRQIFDFRINQCGTVFQQKVWQELENIPFGKTISYLELAKKLGDPKVIRAAASANGKNKLWIVVPCHRVIGSDGSLTGYAGGLWRKKWLLAHESNTEQLQLFC
jgi:methylated-DNA-[protein]-cysteine S-methyltransferase